jgi:hypothetical protein
MLRDIAVVTPSVLVAGGFLFAVGAFLRHEMMPRRRGERLSDDISPDDTIADAVGRQARHGHDDEDAPGAV